MKWTLKLPVMIDVDWFMTKITGMQLSQNEWHIINSIYTSLSGKYASLIVNHYILVVSNQNKSKHTFSEVWKILTISKYNNLKQVTPLV